MTGSAFRPPQVGLLMWVGAFVLAGCGCAGSLTAAVDGARWPTVMASAAGAGLVVVLLVLLSGYGAVRKTAALTVAGNQRLAAELRQCGSALEQRDSELKRRENAQRALLAAQSAAVASEARLWDRLDEQAESSRLAVVTLARRVQASAHRIQEEATRMAQRHQADVDVLESSMRVDHAAAQQARHAQSLAVLCGEWPAQQWPEPLALVDVVRAAAGRIVPYQRVTVLGDPDVAAAAVVVEPLIHLVAELLANAAQSSPPATQVQVGGAPGPAGRGHRARRQRGRDG